MGYTRCKQNTLAFQLWRCSQQDVWSLPITQQAPNVISSKINDSSLNHKASINQNYSPLWRCRLPAKYNALKNSDKEWTNLDRRVSNKILGKYSSGVDTRGINYNDVYKLNSLHYIYIQMHHLCEIISLFSLSCLFFKHSFEFSLYYY